MSGAPIDRLLEILAELRAGYPDAKISGAGVTGSGRNLITDKIEAHAANEITAHAAAAARMHPGVRTIIEIGGQDSKLVVLKEGGEIDDFRMNELCAAGTGAFLDQQATRLGLSIEDFAALAEGSTSPAPIAGRCAVFAKTDMTHHQQEGRPLADIVAGLNEALVRSYMAGLVRGRDLPRPIAFQGGVASNRGLANTFRRMLKAGRDELIIPKNHLTMGAIGAAIMARNAPFRDKIKIGDLADFFAENAATGRVQANHLSRLTRMAIDPIDPSFEGLNIDGDFLGIDMGSVSVKLAVIGRGGLIHSDYRISDGKPLNILKAILGDMKKKIEDRGFSGVGITGSGRNFIGKLIGADVILNEITAQVMASTFIMPDVDTVIEIGGQDAKFMRISGGRATHFEMNRVCAAGTGAFLQEQAARLHIDLERDFADEAFASERPADLGARCTVFMESDLVSHQQMGFSKRDLIAGLSISVITNYLEKVVSGCRVGNNILFLGGVAENPAIVSALAIKLRRRVTTSTVGKLSGAIGAAIAASNGRRDGKFAESGFLRRTTDLSYENFNCDECPNGCLITRALGTPTHTFGGRCGRWEGPSRQRKSVEKSLLKRRFDLTDRASKAVDGRRIGIPMALMAFDMLPAWKKFFEELGHEVIVSPPTDQRLLDEGIKRLVVETCLPVKAFCAHINWLQTRSDADFIFVPSMVFSCKDAHDRDTSHCPYIQSLAQLARPLAAKPVINPVINWKWHPDDERMAMVRCAAGLGHSRRTANESWKRARMAQELHRKELRRAGSDVLERLSRGDLKRVFLIIGKDYNVLDSQLNSRAVEFLERIGETIITQDMLTDDGGRYSPAFRPMIWTHGKEILAAAEIAAKTAGLYPIMITSFGCGPDSFTTKFAKEAVGDKPFLMLEVDEHSSSVGMETRIEAFLDSLPRSKTVSARPPRPAFIPKPGIRRVFLPSFSDHGYAFAAAIRRFGLEPVLTGPPNDESLRLGSLHSTSGECHPYTLMLGDYIRAARAADDFSDACYFMPDSGLCRVGQFGAQMRLVAEEEGLGLPIYTNINDIIPSRFNRSRSNPVRVLLVYWEMMRAMDFLTQKFFETRAYEVNPGSTDLAHAGGRGLLWNCILENRPHDGIKKAVAALDSVDVDRTRTRYKIGITGDYYTRICDYANSDIFRDIEKLGGVVMLPPTMSEFVKYDSYQKPIWSFHHRNPGQFMGNIVAKMIVGKREKKMRDLFGGGLHYDIPLEYKREMQYIEPYMSEKLPSGLTASVASILEQIHAGADGILNLITFHCTYGLILSSVLASIDKDHPNLPKLTLIFEGLKPTHNRSRLEAFMERIRRKKCWPK